MVFYFPLGAISLIIMDGYFKVHRKILDSQVFAHQIALKIWIWCLAKVTYKERFVSIKIGKGETTVKLKPGQFIFGRFKAEDELNIDGSTIYKWIQKFASPEFDMIRIESNNQYSIITICNWEQYQDNDNDKVTTKEQPKNNQVTTKEQPSNTNNNDKKENKDKKEKNKYADFVSMLPEEYQKLISEHGEENTKVFVTILNNYKGSNGKKYKSDYLTILNWVIDKAKNDGKYIKAPMMP